MSSQISNGIVIGDLERFEKFILAEYKNDAKKIEQYYREVVKELFEIELDED